MSEAKCKSCDRYFLISNASIGPWGFICEDCQKKYKTQCPPHSWDKSGEKCLKCGDKDWM